MVIFPQSKINLGLYIIRRRPDGYHDISSVLAPIGWTDVLEAVKSDSYATRLFTSGNAVDCPPEKNLVMKALWAVEKHIGNPLPTVDIYLRKIVPDGAGLGGGSADAAAMVKLLDGLMELHLTDADKQAICASIGADCPFFLHDGPMLASGTGTDLTPVDIPQLKGKHIVVVKPRRSVSTAEAYAGVVPAMPDEPIEVTLKRPVSEWRENLKNMFEPSVGAKLPEIESLKQWLYDNGAEYAAMSGSGSAVFGLFEGDILSAEAQPPVEGCRIFRGVMS